MKITRILLFSDGLKWLLKQTTGILRIVWRMLLSMLKGFKGLRVDSLLINDVFLLSNGLIQVRWKVRYAWTMRINGARLDPGKGFYALYPTDEEAMLDIRIRGLFRNFRRQFTVRAAGSISPGAFPLPLLQKPLLAGNMAIRDIGTITPFITPFKVNDQALAPMVDMKIANFQIILPPLQTPTNHDQRLLRNA
ncbi:MAG TPA: hypothetical protein VHD83_19120 [Puia sp.]|nr:hypothetical protein [Puia sp.]